MRCIIDITINHTYLAEIFVNNSIFSNDLWFSTWNFFIITLDPLIYTYYYTNMKTDYVRNFTFYYIDYNKSSKKQCNSGSANLWLLLHNTRQHK